MRLTVLFYTEKGRAAFPRTPRQWEIIEFLQVCCRVLADLYAHGKMFFDIF